MYMCKYFGSYPRNFEHKKDFQKYFSSLIFETVYLPVAKFSNGIITSGLNNGRSKTNVVNMFTLPKQIPRNIQKCT